MTSLNKPLVNNNINNNNNYHNNSNICGDVGKYTQLLPSGLWLGSTGESVWLLAEARLSSQLWQWRITLSHLYNLARQTE